MRYKIGPIVQEDKKPEKIRRALARGAGGVIVENPAPAEVMSEYEALVVDRDGTVSPLLIADQDAPDHCRWLHEPPSLKATQAWLKEQFAWAAAERLCRPAQGLSGKQNLLRLWLNQDMSLPWHIDPSSADTPYSDIHLHIAGTGINIASSSHPLQLQFNKNKTPYLQHPTFGLKDADDPKTQKLLRKKLDAYLENRGLQILTLKPGQTLFFNEKCLHASAGGQAPRLRAAIF